MRAAGRAGALLISAANAGAAFVPCLLLFPGAVTQPAREHVSRAPFALLLAAAAGTTWPDPGATAYYNSVAKQINDWGADFVKADCMFPGTPYPPLVRRATAGGERVGWRFLAAWACVFSAALVTGRRQGTAGRLVSSVGAALNTAAFPTHQ